MNSKRFLLVSDIDGTLVDDKMHMPEVNAAAISRFKERGGLFTLATGRTYKAAMPYAERVGVNAPAVTFNGAALYDYNRQRFIFTDRLGSTAAGVVKSIYDAFPDVGIEIHTTDGLYMLRATKDTLRHIEDEHLSYTDLDIGDIGAASRGDWLKILFTAPGENMDRLENYTAAIHGEGLRFIRSGGMYFEMLGAGADKGSALVRLAESLGVDMCDVYAIGDFFNDMEMLRASGHAACPSAAPAEVKSLCEYIARPVVQGAVADYIDYILK